MLDDSSKPYRQKRSLDESSVIWQEYQFDTKSGNREELVVTDITIKKDPLITEQQLNWQSYQTKKNVFLATLRSNNSVLEIYDFDFDNGILRNKLTTSVKGEIVSFTFIILDNDENSTGILACVEEAENFSLEWYRITDTELMPFLSKPIEYRIKKILFLREEPQKKLFFLKDDYDIKGNRSTIYVYTYRGDLFNDEDNLCKRVNQALDVRVCPIYDRSFLAVQNQKDITLYDFLSDDVMGRILQRMQNLFSTASNNFVCFKSGYHSYVAISGPEAIIYTQKDDQFQLDLTSENFFHDVGEISWIENIPIDTYRAESLLLVQMSNASVVALTWRGTGFEMIRLPNQELDKFDLSKTTVIPGYGFIANNRLVKIGTKLRELPRPVYDQKETLIKSKSLIETVLDKQERDIDETYKRIAQTAESAVIYQNSVIVGSTNLTFDEIYKIFPPFDENSIVNSLRNVKQKLDEIDENLKKQQIFNHNTHELIEIEINGDFTVNNTLHVKHLTVGPTHELSKLKHREIRQDESQIIVGAKSFPSLDVDKMNVTRINGVPIEEFKFDSDVKDYNGIDFSMITHLIINGSLTVDHVNEFNLTDLMSKVIWKNQHSIIPGEIIIDGDIEAKNGRLDSLNGLAYPDDYVLQLNNSVSITGEKYFDVLTIDNLLDVNTLNNDSITDFVILNGDVKFEKPIKFENAIIDGVATIDKEIIGLPKEVYSEPLINETDTITRSDITFVNLIIKENIVVEESLNDLKWSDFDDILLKTDKNAKITGKKTFANEVKISSANIKSNLINGHLIEEFVTKNTLQKLPNLRRISANVTLGEVMDEDVKDLEDHLNQLGEKEGLTNCLSNMGLTFAENPVIDKLVFEKINFNTTFAEFHEKLNSTLQNVYVKNVTASDLYVEEIITNNINDYALDALDKEFIKISGAQKLTGNYTIDNLEVDILNATFVNSFPANTLDFFKTTFESVYNGLISGSIPVKALTVTGKIETLQLNNVPLENIYDINQIESIILENNVSIRNLTVLNKLNSQNFSELVADAILKTDTDILVTGHKTFENLNCKILDTSYLNGHSINDILDPDSYQEIEGPVTISGSVTVKNNFSSTGKIDGIPYNDFTNSFKYLTDGLLQLQGNLRFSDNITIENLVSNGSIQNIPFNSFMETVVFKKSNNIIVSGSKTFKNTVTFEKSLCISERLNELDLKSFYENAIFIDKPFEVNSNVIFDENIQVDDDITVLKSLEAKSIKGVDWTDLKTNIIYTNAPTYISAPMMINNVTFESNLQIEFLNDNNKNFFIPLHTEQYIETDCLKGDTITVRNIIMDGFINNHTLHDIQHNTLMLYGQQTITGDIKFHGDVISRNDFNAREINGIGPEQIISTDTDDTIIGNFEFKDSIALYGNLTISGSLNGINLIAWQAMAVTTTFPIVQIIHGNWKVYGNVYFENDVIGNGYLNGICVKDVSTIVERKTLELDNVAAEEKENIRSFCEDISVLKEYAENQVYKFNTFEYLQIMQFEKRINSVHFFELDELDYLLVNTDDCVLDAFVYNGDDFVRVESISKFGIVYRWFTLNYENSIYFVTIGQQNCGKGPGNLWKIKDNGFMFVSDLGNIADVKIMENGNFLVLVDQRLEIRSVNLNVTTRIIHEFDHLKTSKFRFVKDSGKILLANESHIFEINQDFLLLNYYHNCFGSSNILNFKLSVFKKEMFAYTGGEKNKDFIFISTNNLNKSEIYQAIQSKNPQSLTVLNFEGNIETLVIYMENEKNIQIYEYKGMEGFKHKDTINLRSTEIFNFKIKKYPYLAKKHCLALINRNRLTILEAKMYGERLDMGPLSCNGN
ncbi:uncharacterized protein fs(1)N isoform X2 [Prorops nasuta]|uniref:uncharacterized protein fs(1)N isoform X2 n=1 Tax=Prorops nasuta TaxID=863751 RepID=UPI0034CEE372